ncbi:hypothetical protein Q5P01_006854 [Channa striata]|uniref:Centromere protein Cenp-F N-terminal domain-containing protein n=1 Tax=Channa striata TaxID=64152 RepID=A0AA88SZ70_CHASR|nr:hypothetical protein Q5P01_006854 [Channa striata]
MQCYAQQFVSEEGAARHKFKAMSWAVEEWKDGLPGKALQKIQEMEVQLDKLKKEKNQKQFQLDSLEAALQKQKQKVDSERTEISALKRENQGLVESCDSLEKARQKATHDLGVKEQQVSYLEGQLNSCRKTIERLEQELKKYKNELDRSQPAGSSSLSSSSSDLQPYTTPQKSFTTPASVPAHRQQDDRLEELQEKYSHELEERKRLESELKVLQVKLLNQSSVSVTHKDIAARQAGSSVFPWQQHDQAHSRHSQDAMETPLKRRGTSLWDAHEETPIKPSQRMSCPRAVQSPSGSSHQMEQLKTLNQELRGRVSELERSLGNQEKEIRSQASKLQELQTQLNQARKDLTERDRNLAKTSHELSQATDKHQQVEAKCSSVEQKLKQVTEEMNCQRHNAESCRRALEQKLKDQEKDSQKELAQLQSSHQALEQQLNQTRTKLTQELQQSKKDSNVLQADMEKMCLQRDKEQDLRKKMEELQKEKNSLTVQLDQSSRRLSQLEDEKRSADQSFKRTQGQLDDLKAKSEGQTEELKRLQSKLDQQTQSSARELENLKKTLSDAETKNERCQNELQKHKQETERLTNRLTNSVSSLNEANDELKKQLIGIEGEKAILSAHIDSLKGELLNKSTELEEREHQHQELQSRLLEAGQKHAKDLENVGVQVAQLQAQVKDLELQLQKEIARAEQAERTNIELQGEHQAACDLARSKDQLVELGQAEISQLRESLTQATAQQEEQNVRLAEEKAVLLKQCEDGISAKAKELEQIKLQFEEAQQELLLTKNQASSMEQFLKIQEQLGAELQNQIKTLSDSQEEYKKMCDKKSEEVIKLQEELKDQRCQTEEKDKQFREAAAKMASVNTQRSELETAMQEMKKEAEILQQAHTEKTNRLLEQISELKTR